MWVILIHVLPLTFSEVSLAERHLAPVFLEHKFSRILDGLMFRGFCVSQRHSFAWVLLKLLLHACYITWAQLKLVVYER